MDFDVTQDYPVGLDRLWQVLGRPDYVERKYRALGSASLRVCHFAADATTIEVDVEREAPVATDVLPSWARLLAGSSQTVRHHTRWTRIDRRRAQAQVEISAVGRNVGARGMGSVIQGSPGSTRMNLHFIVHSPLPGLGKRVAELFARQVRHGLAADHAFTIDYLRARTPRR